MTETTTNGETQPRRRAHPVGFPLGLLLLLIGFPAWSNYLSVTVGGVRLDGINGQLVVIGFLYWFVPWCLGTLVTGASAKRRKRVTLSLLAATAVMLAVAIVITAVGTK